MKDARAEQELKRLKFSFTYKEAIALKDVLTEEAALNIRPSGMSDDNKYKLFTALVDGCQLPAIVVAPHPKRRGKFVPLDGLHRISAHLEVGHAEVDAYVVDTDSEQDIRLLQAALNIANGESVPKMDRVALTVSLVETTGCSIVKAAKTMRVNEHDVESEVRYRAVIASLAAHPDTREIMDQVKLSLKRTGALILHQLQRVDERASWASFAAKYKPTNEQLKVAIGEYVKAPNSASAQAVIEKWAKRMTEGKDDRPARGRTSVLQRMSVELSKTRSLMQEFLKLVGTPMSRKALDDTTAELDEHARLCKYVKECIAKNVALQAE